MSNLTAAQRRMLIASDPDDRTGDEGTGIELRTGRDYAVANALKRKGFGDVTGPGGTLPGMYWSNAAGLEKRRDLLGIDAQEDHTDPALTSTREG